MKKLQQHTSWFSIYPQTLNDLNISYSLITNDTLITQLHDLAYFVNNFSSGNSHRTFISRRKLLSKDFLLLFLLPVYGRPSNSKRFLLIINVWRLICACGFFGFLFAASYFEQELFIGDFSKCVNGHWRTCYL
jgi:hypothetical protein